VHRIRKNEHSIEPLASTRSRDFELFFPRFCRCGMDVGYNVVLDGVCHTRNLFRADNIHGAERHPKVDNADGDVNTEGVPAVGLDEML